MRSTFPMYSRMAAKGSHRACPRLLAAHVALALGLATSPDVAHASMQRPRPFNTIDVSNCNDNGAGSLREAIAEAVSGDMVLLNQLPCSVITLTTGAITLSQDALILVGPPISGAMTPALRIERGGSGYDRIFNHTGTGTLELKYLAVAGGRVHRGNGSAYGGCIYSNGQVDLFASTVSSCYAGGYAIAKGGGVFARNGLTLTGSALSHNTVYTSDTAATAAGGGAYVKNSFYAFESAISGNVASDRSHYGSFAGGFLVGGPNSTTLNASTVDNNQAAFSGGFEVEGGAASSVTITNSTISSNAASDRIGAALIQAPLTLRNSTIAFNRGERQGAGGLILFSSGAPYATDVDSSIIAENQNPPTGAIYAADLDTGPPGGTTPLTIAGSNDLIIASGSLVTLPFDTLRVDPQLEPLVGNGGITRTHALAASSPAVDHGNNVANLATDQRGTGFARLVGAAPDIGAFERQNAADGDYIFANGFDP